ncbi:MAG: histidine kinase [Bacteroidetes bacterium]|nr:histidine kinase [Bacteroidota bacterium]
MIKFIFSLLFLFVFLSFKGQVKNGLVAKYSFNNGNAQDETGNNHAKVIGASLAEDRFGNERSAYYFQGNAYSYLNLGTSSVLKPIRGSVSLWFKIDNITYNGTGAMFNSIILTKSQEGDDFFEGYGIGIDIQGKKLGATTTYSEDLQVGLRSLRKFELGRWYHAVITYDDDFFCFYLDGVLENRSPKNFKSRFLKTDSVMVATSANLKNNRFFNGYVDDIEIYDHVLSPDDILDLYLLPNPNKYKIIQKWILILVAAFFLLILTIHIIKKHIHKLLEREKNKNKLLNQKYEQENRVLKAQMNPHFLFNSLNTIQQFILINQNEKAQSYLSKFSRLLRKILESNMNDSISLKDEVELCEKYLEIESLRFNNVFKFNISVLGNIDASSIYIPHFLVQPFIENAIWHGILPKTGDKHLLVCFSQVDEGKISCIIDDNGVGRTNERTQQKEEKKSLALNFIRQRLDLMGKIYQTHFDLFIIDKKNSLNESDGTKIILTFPILNK